MKPFLTQPLAVPERVHLEVGPAWNQTIKFSCKHPKRFSSGMLRNEARGNLTDYHCTNVLPKKIFGKASMNKCMVVKLFQEFFLFLMNEERGCRLELFISEYVKETVLLRTGPRHHVNEKPIRTYAERFHTESLQSSHVNAA